MRFYLPYVDIKLVLEEMDHRYLKTAEYTNRNVDSKAVMRADEELYSRLLWGKTTPGHAHIDPPHFMTARMTMWSLKKLLQYICISREYIRNGPINPSTPDPCVLSVNCEYGIKGQ